MKIHYILHAPFEKLGAIETWAKDKGHSLSGTNTYAGEKLPTIKQFDFLIVMGGPQSPCELDKYPYLRDEIALTKQAIDNHKKVLGICLGAQIIAESLGAKTERSPHKEIGNYPVTLTAAGKNDPLFGRFPQQFDVMHWHNDMPGIPDKAVVLAESLGCPKQAFRYSDNVYGFQFHMEMTPELVKGMVANCPEDLQTNKFVQTKAELSKIDFTAMNQKMHLALDYLAKSI